MRYRLYVDESGDHTYKNIHKLSYRYLSLTGIAIEAEYYRNSFQPELEKLKQDFFSYSPDEPIILHREDIYNRRDCFGILCNPEVNKKWEQGLYDFVHKSQFKMFTIVIDKKRHKELYGKKAKDPYHLCLEFLLERYRGFLMYIGGIGDVMAEGRGAPEDLALKDTYTRIYLTGTQFVSSQDLQVRLTSRQIKIKRKLHNIGGLQLCDLLVHPAKLALLEERGYETPHFSNFGRKLSELFKFKYDLIGKKLFPEIQKPE